MKHFYQLLFTIRQQLHKEWIKVVDELGLKERKNGPMNAAFFLRLFETSPMFFNFDQVMIFFQLHFQIFKCQILR